MTHTGQSTTRATWREHGQYLGHLQQESRRFVDALERAPDDARVPTCPDWSASDLLWHLAEVQWFWGAVVSRRLTDPERDVGGPRPERPADRADLMAFAREATAGLVRALTERAPQEECWTWAPEQSVAWVARRQAHEALIHRLDAELTVAAPTPLDPSLALDGVDEALRVMFGGVPTWASFSPAPGHAVRVVASDAGVTWRMVVGRFTGTGPESGRTFDEPVLDVADDDDGSPVDATVTAAAADLDCWLWNRPPVLGVRREGSEAALGAVEEVLRVGIQ